MDASMIVVVLGILGVLAWAANFIIANIKDWPILYLLNLGCLMPIGGVLVLELLFGNTGFFGALVILMSMGFAIVLMLSAVVAIAVTNFVDMRSKHETRS